MNSDKNYLAVNKELWNAKTAIHINSSFYDIPAILAGKSSLIGPELSLIDDIKGKKVLHLQCHFGLDSLSLARMGASVVGLDFSQSAIDRAIALYEDQDVDLSFVCTDVYSAEDELDSKFDMIYTSYGTIGWLPDLNKWAAVIERLLKPNGKLVFAEFHPVVWMFNEGFTELEYSYFNRESIHIQSEGTYADRNSNIDKEEISWNHPLTDVFNALFNAGLNISQFKEFDYSPYACFDPIVKIDDNKYQIEGLEGKLPMMYYLVAQKLN